MENEFTKIISNGRVRRAHFVCLFLLFTFLSFVDQLSKYLVRHSGGFYICNQGIAFGLQLPEFVFWLVWINVVFILICLILWNNFSSARPNSWLNIFLLAILAGAFGNIIDRLWHGCIIDFIDLKFWPVFNLADIFISLGSVALIISILKNRNISS